MSHENPVTPDTIKELVAKGFITRSVGHYYKRQCTWNNKMARLYAKEPKSWTNFSFMPKGEVT